MPDGQVAHCRFCAAPLNFSVLDLGLQPFSNAYLRPGEESREKRYPLHVRLCTECLLVQTDFDAPPAEIFSADYAYFSSYSASWLAHAKAYSEAMIERFGLNTASMVVEVASNDGYLLQNFVAKSIPSLGVEPARDAAEAAMAKGVRTEIAFFGVETARRLRDQGYAADLIAANNVLAHVPAIADFVSGFAHLLKPEGVATFEFPHLLRLIEGVQFDTIYHEHFSYLSLLAVERIFAACGLRVFDVEELSTHGGSLRVFACLPGASHSETRRTAKVRADEAAAGLGESSGYAGLAPRVARIKSRTLEFFGEARAAGKMVAGYGAAAKGNTFLNTCGLTAEDIIVVADLNPHKQGRLLPGSHVPIVAPNSLLALRPDYTLILPWNLKSELVGQLAGMPGWMGRFVIAIPELEIIA
jgi:SAM-dependent methyltransferase